MTEGGVSQPLVSGKALVKRFGDFEAVRGIDIEVNQGEAFGFLGPNGAGKSSTMRMIACVSPRSDGDLRVLGMDPDIDGPRIRARIGVCPQQDNLDTELTVRENLQVYGRFFGLSRAQVREKAVELMEFAQLSDRANAEVESLSGGMKRRLTIARSLVNDPELLLLDEPAAGLDLGGREDLLRRLTGLAYDPNAPTMVLVTHHVEEVPAGFTHALLLRHGSVVAQGPIEYVMTAENLSHTFGVPLILDRGPDGRWYARAQYA